MSSVNLDSIKVRLDSSLCGLREVLNQDLDFIQTQGLGDGVDSFFMGDC